MNPGFALLLPLAYRAQTYHYLSPPVIYSSIYFVIVTILFFWKFVNKRLAFGKKRGFDWTEEVVVITGGSSGLGLLIAETYGMRGVSVAVLDVRKPEGGEARNVSFYKCDVGDKKQVAAAAKEIERDLGTPTVLINNAAVVYGKGILELSDEEIEKYGFPLFPSSFHNCPNQGIKNNAPFIKPHLGLKPTASFNLISPHFQPFSTPAFYASKKN